MLSNTFFHVTIRTNSNLFDTKATRYAFLNIWRSYIHGKFQTCTFTLVTDRFECILVGGNSKDINHLQVRSLLVSILSEKCLGVFEEAQINEITQSLIVEPLYSEKEMIYKSFDMHTMPQRLGITTDYRSYPFSSYRALSNGSASALAKQTVWNWFGGKYRFTAFHQAYAGWLKSPYYDIAS